MEDTKHCTPCKTKDKESKAEYYCTDCEAYYCEECFELHPRVPYLAKHIVLKHDDIDVWSRDQYKCSTHGKNLEFFCRDHKMLCCHVCISLKHRSCTNMDYIQEEAMKKCLEDNKEKMMKQIEEQIQIIESSFDKVKRKVETNQTSKVEYIEELQAFRSRINAMFDSLVEKAFGEMDEKFDQNTKYSENVSEKLVRFGGKLKNLKQQIKSSTVGKEALVYISLQRGEELIEDISRVLSKIDFSVEKEKYKPVIDEKIEGYVKGLAQIAVLEDDKMREECVASDLYTEKCVLNKVKECDKKGENQYQYDNICCKEDSHETLQIPEDCRQSERTEIGLDIKQTESDGENQYQYSYDAGVECDTIGCNEDSPETLHIPKECGQSESTEICLDIKQTELDFLVEQCAPNVKSDCTEHERDYKVKSDCTEYGRVNKQNKKSAGFWRKY